MMKIIVDADSDRVLGMHMVGTDSPEIMQVRSRPSDSHPAHHKRLSSGPGLTAMICCPC